MRKIQLDEPAVIAMYEQVENAREVARAFNVSSETIYRLLKRNGIKRTHRHDSEREPKAQLSNCRSKYCPALVMMLNTTYGWRAKQIAEATGYKMSGVQNILCRHGFKRQARTNKSDCDLDQVEREYLAGTTTYELGKRYGVSHSTISKWMCERGIRLGKGAHQESRQGRSKADGEFIYSERMQEINQRKHDDGERRFIQNLERHYGDRFEYVGGFRDGGKPVATIRCMTCGHEFVHGTTEMDKKEWRCPECTRLEREHRKQERDGMRYERMFAQIREYAVEKTCAECGSKFQSVSPSAKYCCKTCSIRARDKYKARTGAALAGHRHYYHVKYGDAYLEHYDRTVTLRALYERDGGVCQICGGPCDWDDKEYGGCGPTYPSIDHIVPRAQGGDHFWSNVQLAHCLCNSRKRDLPDEVAKLEVVADAKAG